MISFNSCSKNKVELLLPESLLLLLEGKGGDMHILYKMRLFYEYTVFFIKNVFSNCKLFKQKRLHKRKASHLHKRDNNRPGNV